MTSPGRTSIGFLCRFGGGANGDSFDDEAGAGLDGSGAGAGLSGSGAGLSVDVDGGLSGSSGAASAPAGHVRAATSKTDLTSGGNAGKRPHSTPGHAAGG